ncbi:MAG: hypothetical protein J6A15_02230 [Clostridia bacterium]|nr:hypothetical protein [Clostridia bacterium]
MDKKSRTILVICIIVIVIAIGIITSYSLIKDNKQNNDIDNKINIEENKSVEVKDSNNQQTPQNEDKKDVVDMSEDDLQNLI